MTMRGRLFSALNMAGKEALGSSSSRRWLHDRPLPHRKVTILGAAGRIGRHLSILMKLNNQVTKLALYDTVPNVHHLVEYVSRLNTRPQAVGYVGGDRALGEALKDSDLVLVTAGAPEWGLRGIVEFCDLCTAISNHCPNATVNLLNCPHTSLDAAKKTFKELGTYKWNRLYGVIDEAAQAAKSREYALEDLGPCVDSAKYRGVEFPEAKDGVAPQIAFAGVVGANISLGTPLIREGQSACKGFPFLESSNINHIKLISPKKKLPKKAATTSGLEKLEWFKQWRAERIARRAGRDLKNMASCNSEI